MAAHSLNQQCDQVFRRQYALSERTYSANSVPDNTSLPVGDTEMWGGGELPVAFATTAWVQTAKRKSYPSCSTAGHLVGGTRRAHRLLLQRLVIRNTNNETQFYVDLMDHIWLFSSPIQQRPEGSDSFYNMVHLFLNMTRQ